MTSTAGPDAAQLDLPAANPAAKTAVIVDGYSTGNFLPGAFARLGIDVLHVQSTAELMPTMLAPAMDAYRHNVICPDAGAVEPTVAALARWCPVAVLAGQEPGVRLADVLSERLGVAGNGSALSAARRDKYRMIETLRAAGIRTARQFKSADPDRIVAWAQRAGTYPVVVKPLSSASTDHVFICAGAADVARAARRVLGARDIFDQSNTEVLVQSYLAGTEYIVDTVSVDARRYVCGVWEYEKTSSESGTRIYDRDVLLDPGAAPVPELIGYVDTVLAALDIRHGPAHAEVITTPEGPALVEIGARLNGNMNPGFHDLCLGANQADLTAMAYARPDEFCRRFGGRVYAKLCEAVVHNTRGRQDGVVDSVDHTVVDKISALPTVHLVSVKLGPGKRIRPTVDLLTSPLRIFMAGPDAAQLRADYLAIQQLKDQVYRVSAAPQGGQS